MSELEDFRRACDMKTWGGRVIAALLDHVAALEQREPQVSRNEPIATPATVERYTAYEYFEWPIAGVDTGIRFKRKPFGTVVAELIDPTIGWWKITLPDSRELGLGRLEYCALVDMMLKSGIWERQA